ncbi:hypothetical protein COU58_01800 [Candidatus Pacearchaeota archaeon CG10_big_fil_rev_8_21_14_0_10_32_42]|nr:MAG: hypothetical protein COU58_01800 [Candidatus Pacearchaeota archaeon CG10_big_fil_rev_8_21_14_0_10_32_42]
MSFLKEQGLINGKDKVSCIFCSIIFGDIPSTKIDENDRAIAILDINPASLGHSLIVPKEHISSKELLPSEVGKLALLVKRNLEKSFNPKRVDLISSNIMGHEIINLLPVYNEETINSERKKLFPNDLEKLKEKIIKGKIEEKEVDKKILEKNIEEINEKNTWLPKRFP